MGKKILVVGASGVIGRSLVSLLRDAGHSVTGTTRTVEGPAILQGLDIQAVVVDDLQLLSGSNQRRIV